MPTSNPVLKSFDALDDSGYKSNQDAMTLQGTICKSILLLLVLGVVTGGAFIWFTDWARTHHGEVAYIYIIRIFAVSFFGSICLVIASVMRKQISPITAPLFSVTEGVALGMASAACNMRYPGVAIQAIGLTVAMCVCLLVSYGLGWITIRATFSKKLSFALCGAIAYCAASILLVLAGVRGVPFATAGVLGGLASVVVVVLPGAALVATCDAVVKLSGEGKPKYLEWFAALGIVTSLVWIYYEMLEMLSKARRSG